MPWGKGKLIAGEKKDGTSTAMPVFDVWSSSHPSDIKRRIAKYGYRRRLEKLWLWNRGASPSMRLGQDSIARNVFTQLLFHVVRGVCNEKS